MSQANLIKDENDILYAASNKLTQASTPVEQLEAISDYARDHGASAAILFYIDSDDAHGQPEWLEVVAEWTSASGSPLGLETIFYIPSFAFNRVWMDVPGRPTLVSDVTSSDYVDPGSRANYMRFNISSVAMLPLNIKGRWVGAVMFAWSKPYLFDERDQRIFTALIQQAAPVVDSVRLFEQTQRRAAELEVAKNEIDILYVASNKLTQAGSSTEQLEAISDYARDNGATAGILFYLENDASGSPKQIEVIAEWVDEHGKPVGIGTHLELTDLSFTQLCVSKPTRPTLVADTFNSDIVDAATREFFMRFHQRAVAILPLNVKGRWVGLIMFAWNTSYLFDERDQRIFTALIQQTAPVVDSVRLFEQTQRRAAELEAAKNEIDILYAVSNRLTQAATPAELLEAIAVYDPNSRADTARLFYIHSDSMGVPTWYETAAEFMPPGIEGYGLGSYWRLEKTPMLDLWQKNAAQPTFIEDVANSPLLTPFTRSQYLAQKIRSVVNLPLTVKDRWIGAVTIGWSQPRAFDGRDHRVYTALIQQAAPIIDSMQLFEQNRERAARAEQLLEVNTALSQARDEHEILQAVSLYVSKHQPSRLMLFYLENDLEGNPSDALPVAIWEKGRFLSSDSHMQKGYQITGASDAYLWMKQPDRALLIEDVLENPYIDETTRTTLAARDGRGLVIIPLYSGGRWQGLIVVEWNESRLFSAEEHYFYTAVIQTAAAVVATRRAYLAQEEARQESEMLYLASGAINAATTFAEIAQAVQHLEVSNHVALSIWENYDFDSASYFEVVATAQDELQPVGVRYPVTDYPIAHHIPRKGLWISEDILNDPRVDPVSAQSWTSLGTYARIGVPLTLNNRWMGTLAFQSSRPRRYTEFEKRIVAGIGDLVTAALERMRLQNEMQQARQRAEILAQVNAALSQAGDEQTILAAAASLAEMYNVSLSMLSYAHHGEICAEARVMALRSGTTRNALPLNTLPVSYWVDRECDTNQLDDIIFAEDIFTTRQANIGGVRNLASKMHWASAVIIPLKTGDQWQGLLIFVWNEKQVFSEEMRDLFRAILPTAASVVTSRRAYLAEEEARRETELRAHELATVAKVSAAAASSILDEDELLNTVTELARTSFEQYTVLIYLLDSEVLMKVNPDSLAEEPILLSDTNSLVANAARTRRAYRSSDTGSEIAVPMVVADKLVGVLNVRSSELNRFTEADIQVMSTLADLIAVAVQNARLYQQAQELAALEERNRLARELHDSVSQAIFGIALGARTARKLLDRDPTRLAEPLDYILSLAEAGLSEMRALIFELRPESLENEGLLAALSKQAASLQARHNINVITDFSEELLMPLETKEALYRIAREALHNTVKHARATEIRLHFAHSDHAIMLEISDNGVGFDTSGSFPGHLGLQSMRERVMRLKGTITLQSELGKGTRVSVNIPRLAT